MLSAIDGIGKHSEVFGAFDQLSRQAEDIAKNLIPDTEPLFPPVPSMSSFDMKVPHMDLTVDDSKWRTANAAEATADAAEATASFTRALLKSMESNVELSIQTREENAEMSRFTRRMSVASLVVSIASVGAAVGALVVALISAQ